MIFTCIEMVKPTAKNKTNPFHLVSIFQRWSMEFARSTVWSNAIDGQSNIPKPYIHNDATTAIARWLLLYIFWCQHIQWILFFEAHWTTRRSRTDKKCLNLCNCFYDVWAWLKFNQTPPSKKKKKLYAIKK